MTVKEMNPDAPILSQLQGEWQKLLIMVLWMTKGKEQLILGAKDMAAFGEAWGSEGPVLLTQGYPDGIKFKLISVAEAREIEAYEKTQRGHA